MKAPQTKLCEFWIEGTFSPLKVSLISGCLYWRGHAWHHVAWSHVQFGAAFSLLDSIFDPRSLYGNTEMTNIPPLSCQDMNETLLQQVFWLWLIKSCSVGTCGLFLLAFVFLEFSEFSTHTTAWGQAAFVLAHFTHSSLHSMHLPPSFTSTSQTPFSALSSHFLISHLTPFPPRVPCSSLNTAGTHQHLYRLWLPAVYSHTRAELWRSTPARTATDRMKLRHTCD